MLESYLIKHKQEVWMEEKPQTSLFYVALAAI